MSPSCVCLFWLTSPNKVPFNSNQVAANCLVLSFLETALLLKFGSHDFSVCLLWFRYLALHSLIPQMYLNPFDPYPHYFSLVFLPLFSNSISFLLLPIPGAKGDLGIHPSNHWKNIYFEAGQKQI